MQNSVTESDLFECVWECVTLEASLPCRGSLAVVEMASDATKFTKANEEYYT